MLPNCPLAGLTPSYQKVMADVTIVILDQPVNWSIKFNFITTDTDTTYKHKEITNKLQI